MAKALQTEGMPGLGPRKQRVDRQGLVGDKLLDCDALGFNSETGSLLPLS